MTPVERLQAAVEKLEALDAASSPAPWHKSDGEHYGIVWAQLTEADPSDPTGQTPMAVQFEVAHVARSADGDLIEALHRTLVAQLAILRFAVDGLYDLPEFLMLADAILGGDS